jgi:hypothetical protein
MATQTSTGASFPLAQADGGTGGTDAATARTALGLSIGTDVQAYDVELAAIAGLTSAADRLPYFTGSGTAALTTFTTAGRALVDDATAADQRTTLGLGTLSTQAANNVSITGGSITALTELAVPAGAGGTTVNASGEICCDTTSATINFYDGTAERVLNPVKSASITIINPDTAVNATVLRAYAALTLKEIVVVLRGSSTPSVTWTLKTSTDRSATGTTVHTTSTTSTTTGSSITSITSPTISSGGYIWLTVSAVSGTVNELNVILHYRQDP